MRKLLAAGLAAVLLVGISAAGAEARVGARPYLIGSTRPLTPVQVGQLEAVGAQVRHVYRHFGGASAVIPPNRLGLVSALPFVTSVSDDPVRQLDFTGELPPEGPNQQYWLDLIDAEDGPGFDGTGVWVAVLDSGFYPNWRDYFRDDSILEQYATAFVAALGNPNQNQWDTGSDPHGMAVAATIVGSRMVDDANEGGFGTGLIGGASQARWLPGVAPGAGIIPVKVCEPIGCFGSAINAGVDYIIDLKQANPSQPIVINESLGGPRLDPVEKAALDAALAAGVVVVASAGNNGSAGMGFPGAYEPVISVGAGGWVDGWQGWPLKTWYFQEVPETGTDPVYIAGFSSRPQPGQYLDVVSTGRYLLLPYPCARLYRDGEVSAATNHRTCASKASPDNSTSALSQHLFLSGTSFSAPTVAGIVALVLEKNPTLTNADSGFGTISDPSSWAPGSLELLLEEAATPIEPGSVTITHRDGTVITETWEAAASGHGWLLVDQVLAAVPSPP